MNNKGITLTEVLVTCCIVAIMGSIAIVNFGSYEDPTQKKELYQSAKVWSARVKTCILNVGGWKIKRFSKANESCPTGESEPCKTITPCRVSGDGHTPKDAKKFKQKLGYDCPGDCLGKVGGDFYCLDIRKEKRGTKYQCIVHFNIKNHREKIYCGTPASYNTLNNNCGASPTYTDLKEAKQNKWPEASSTTAPPQADPANSST